MTSSDQKRRDAITAWHGQQIRYAIIDAIVSGRGVVGTGPDPRVEITFPAKTQAKSA